MAIRTSSFFSPSAAALFVPIAAFAGFLALNACGSSSSSSSTAPGTDAGADVGPVTGGQSDSGSDASTTTGGGVTVSPAALTIYPGGTATVTVARGNVPGDLKIAFDNLPTGVSAQNIPFPAAAATQAYVLTANASVLAPQTATVQADGVSGTTQQTFLVPFTLNVVGAPGTLDDTFGVSGIARGSGANSTQATGVAFQKSGAIVIGGFSGQTYAVGRYTSAGAIDTTFGTNGFTLTTPAGQNSFSNTGGIAVDATDRIVLVGGSSDTTNGQQGRMLRYTSTGTLDTTFGMGGYALFANETLYGVVPSQADFVASGYNLTTLTGTLNEIDGTGANVTGFKGNASAIFQPPAPNNTLDVRVYGVGVQSSGKIVACGDQGASCARFDALGNVDTTFGTAGFNVTSATKHTFSSLAVQSDDSIIAVGTDGGSPQQFFVQKLTKDGALDTTFNTTGSVATALGDVGGDSYAMGVAVQADGKIVVVGEATANSRTVMAVARYTKTGALDTTFGTAGTLFVPVATATAQANAVVIQADGRIVVAGHGDMDFALLRVWP